MNRWPQPGRVLGFFLAGDSLWWYVIDRDRTLTGNVALDNDAAEGLRRRVGSVRRRFTQDDVDAADVGTSDADIQPILRPALDAAAFEPDNRPIIICPHDVLLRLPWASIVMRGRPLVEYGPLFIVPGLTMLESIGRRSIPAQPRLLVVADPEREDAEALPGAKLEARAIEAMFRGRCSLLEGAAASVEQFFQAATRHDLLHFCCHGSFGGLGSEPGRLYLAPTAGDADGVLTSRQIIETLDLRSVSVVNLAACDSGLVRSDRTTEIDGVTRAFLCAGAGAVIGSLWPLDDAAAAQFSVGFYERLKQAGDPGRALQQTQLASMNGELGPMMTSPSNWAGYVVVGSPMA
jgi:CHAT domain-containing protein